MVWSADNTLTIIIGAPNHIFINISVPNTSPPSLRNCGRLEVNPRFISKFGINPDTPFRIHFHASAITMDGNAQGIISNIL